MLPNSQYPDRIQFCNGCSCPIRPAQWASPLVHCAEIKCDCHRIWWQAVERERMRESVRGGKGIIQRLWEVMS